jgi:hypothetical protein
MEGNHGVSSIFAVVLPAIYAVTQLSDTRQIWCLSPLPPPGNDSYEFGAFFALPDGEV